MQNDEVFYDIVGINPTKIGATPIGVSLIQGQSPIDSKPQNRVTVNPDSTTKAPNLQVKHSEILQTTATKSAPNFQTPSRARMEQLPTQMERDAEAAVRLGQASRAMQGRAKTETAEKVITALDLLRGIGYYDAENEDRSTAYMEAMP